MDYGSILTSFFAKASEDARISIAHIGLFTTLLQLKKEQSSEWPLVIFAAQVMKTAKISSTATYHRLIRELNEYGYIRYEPSFFKRMGSSIWL